MGGSARWKLFLVLVVIGLAGYYLWPSYQYYFRMTPEERLVAKDLHGKIIHLGLDLMGGMHVILEADMSQVEEGQGADALDRVVEVLRNRVDQFGVAEPVIQKQGKDRIVVDLAGVQSEEDVRILIGTTARLEFRLCAPIAVASQITDRLDRELVARGAADSTDLKPLSSRFAVYYNQNYGIPSGAFVTDPEIPAVRAMIDTMMQADRAAFGDVDLLWGHDPRTIGGVSGKVLYFVYKNVEVAGAEVADARSAVGLNYERPNAVGVSLTFSNLGATRFARVTKANVGNHLAIVLDDVVRSAPVIQDWIRGGRASITGNFTDQEAATLATVLRAGALPVDVKIAEERTVGPSLGRDSIDMSIEAGIWAVIFVVAFMVIWYKGSGILAIVAMCLQVFLILAGLGALRGTLTVPGIAGIILTIGMAVDANVLIFERIREEIRNHKTVRAAIDAGYGRAFTTILDSNLTTLIAALVLFQYGTGPIRGFAVTLSIGMIANMLTAVLVTRMIFDLITSGRRVERLSI